MNALRIAPVVLLLCAASASAQLPKYEASVSADRDTLKLWESVQVTLAVEGPAPMRAAVELPKQLLTDATNGDWRIRPKGDAEVVPLPGGRERWRQTFRLDPHAPGKPLLAAFAPIKVNGKPIDQELVVAVTVERTGGDDTPLPESLPVTTIEDLPPLPATTAAPSRIAVVVSSALVAACALLVAFVWRRARRSKPVSPGAWARAALAKLEAERLSGPDVAERVANILRRFVERWSAIAATKLTTSELYEATTVQGWPADTAQALRALLDECDLAKFAGAAPDFEGCARLLGAARDWLDRTAPARQGV